MGGGGQTQEVYAFKVESIHARVGLYKDLKEKLRDTGSHALLACLFQENSPHFRLSLITRSLNEKGEIDYSHPKRQSFLLGKDIKTNSAKQQLSKLQGASSLEDIEEAFSLEQLSREFFQAITKHFTHLYENIKFPKTLNEEASRAFSLRLLARVLFCKFLERKGLIPSGIWDTSLSEHYYYHEVLEPLFFGTLNTPKSERNYGLLDSKITHLLDSIPYLNGGLFSPQENDFYEPKSPQAHINTLQVPNGILKALFKNLSEFHFTLDESTPIDQEVGLDPEMLGMVFENLLSMLFTDHKIDNLSSLRKQTGSYYTPREIVSYMAKSCILEYLKTHTTISDSSLRSLVFEYEHEFGYQEILSLLTALSGFRVLDPACGSGAFPMGILQELTQILEALDEEGTAFMALQSQEFKASHQDKDPRYIRKLHILQNNIYGVDIQPMATEISRLRCFLSLICDEDKNKIEPLPNLEFKFLTANSLMPYNPCDTLKYDKYEQHVKELEDIRAQTFTTGAPKKSLQESFLSLISEMASRIKEAGMVDSTPLTEWNPYDPQSQAKFFNSNFMFGIEKFDCVIGNPPYVRQEAIKKQKPKLQEYYPHTYQGQADLYVYFYERGHQILRDGGLLSYITSNKYTRAGYGKHLRTFLLKNTQILSYIDFNGAKVFESASVDTSIMTFAKRSPSSTHYLSYLSCQDKSTLKDATHFTPLAQSSLSVESFSFASQDALTLKAKIESTGTPLKEWDIAINRGILTGYNEAFIITTPKREEILSACKDKDERQRTSQLIKKILRGRDIQRYGYVWAGMWIIALEFGAHEYLESQYPTIYAHLLQYEERLKARGQCTNKPATEKKPYTGQHHWLELDNNPTRKYLESFEKEKIVYPCIMAKEPRFAYDNDAMYAVAPANIITGERKQLLFMQALLNSKLIYFAMRKFYMGGGIEGELKTNNLQKIPIPKIDSTNQSIADKIIVLVEEILKKKKQDSATDTTELESQINALVYTLYNLTDEEIELIEKG